MHEQVSRHTNRLVGVAFLFVGTALLYASLQMPAGAQLGDPGPAFLPRIIAILIILFALVLIWRPPGTTAQEAAGSAEDEEGVRENPVKLLLTALGALLFVPAMSLVGFLPATVVYLIATMWVLSPQRLTRLPIIVGVAAAFSLGLWFALTNWLGIAPPQGSLF